MIVFPLNSHRSSSALLVCLAWAMALRWFAVSFGLAILLSSSENAITGLRRLDSQTLQILRPDNERLISRAGASFQVEHVEIAVQVAEGRASGVFLLRVHELLGQQLPGEQVFRFGEENGERDTHHILRTPDLDRHDVPAI